MQWAWQVPRREPLDFSGPGAPLTLRTGPAQQQATGPVPAPKRPEQAHNNKAKARQTARISTSTFQGG